MPAEHTRPLPALRFDINEVAGILRTSRAQLYKRIAEGAIKVQKDGARTYVTLREVERYVAACTDSARQTDGQRGPLRVGLGA